MKQFLFVDEMGNVSQSDNLNVMEQQCENDTTLIVDTYSDKYRYGSGNTSEEWKPIQEQVFYAPGEPDESEL